MINSKEVVFQIRFDNSPEPGGARFVEIENGESASICLGEWKKDGDEWLLSVSREEIEEMRAMSITEEKSHRTSNLIAEEAGKGEVSEPANPRCSEGNIVVTRTGKRVFYGCENCGCEWNSPPPPLFSMQVRCPYCGGSKGVRHMMYPVLHNKVLENRRNDDE